MMFSRINSKAQQFLTFSALSISSGLVGAAPTLQPDINHGQTARIVAKQLSLLHYTRKVLDDSLSEQVWRRYISLLDEKRIDFTQLDIAAFEPWRQIWDDQLKQGQLTAAFSIYNLYLQRKSE